MKNQSVDITPPKQPINAHGASIGELAGARAAFDLPGSLPFSDYSLVVWSWRYFQSEVLGVLSENTVEAKRRDLQAFLEWFYAENGRLGISNWLPRDTQAFLDTLERAGRSPATVNRVLATLKKFARWASEQPDAPFRSGLPTRGIKEFVADEPVRQDPQAPDYLCP